MRKTTLIHCMQNWLSENKGEEFVMMRVSLQPKQNLHLSNKHSPPNEIQGPTIDLSENKHLAKVGADTKHLDAFLLDSVDEMKRSKRNISAHSDDLSSKQDMAEFLDTIFDYDMLSAASSHSGANFVGEDNDLKDSPKDDVFREDHIDTTAENDHLSDLSSLYKKMHPQSPTKSKSATLRLDSGIGETL